MSKANILIVEDEHIVALDIQNTLERNDYQAAGQTDRGEDAVKKAEKLHPDLVLMDIGLKGEIDGIEAAIQIRTRFDIPVIFLTAFANQSTMKRARLAEPYGYLLKPFDERELFVAIDLALYKHAMEIKLRESENKFRNVVEHASDGIVLADSQGNIIEWNTAMEQITGLKSSDAIGQLFSDVIFRLLPKEKKTTGFQEANISLFKAAINSGYAKTRQITENEIETPQGERRTIQSNGFAMNTSKGMMGGVILRDITERKLIEAELQKLLHAVEQSANTIVITDAEGKIEYANPKFVEISGYSLPEVLGQNPRILKSGEHSLEFYRNLWKTIKAGRVWKGEMHNRRKDGTLYWEDSTITPVYNPARHLANFIAVKEDITARKMLEEAERDQRQFTKALLDTFAALNSTLNLDEVLDRILNNIGKLVMYDAAMVLLVKGHAIRKILHRSIKFPKSLDQPQIGNTLANLINVPILNEMIETRQPCLIPDTQSDSRWRNIPGMGWIRSFISAPIEIQGNIEGIINIISSTPDFFTPLHAGRIMAFANQAAVAMENAQLFEKAKHLSMTDSLTELFNMRYFLDFGKLEFERVRRYARTLSVAMADVDHFKKINDTHGHGVGDLALYEIAARIKNAVRTVDIVARYGGEEFVILMPETGLDDACQVAERVRQIVSDNPIENKDAVISVTLSLGVAEIEKNTKSLDELIKHADQALYKAKANGRNRVDSYSPAK